ncbi:MAG: sigma-54 dependent transcriptional regulator [candidate division Zixibacteria bacterium]
MNREKSFMTKDSGRVLIVDDDEDVLQAAKLLLKKHVSSVMTESDPQNIPSLLSDSDFNVILLDMNFTQDVSSGKEGFHWLEKILEIDPSTVVILITAYGDIEMAVQGIKAGAADFVLKPWQNEKLLATISAGIRLSHSHEEIITLKAREKQLSQQLDLPYKGILGESEAMRDVFNTIEKVADTDANVLILGENGTGKELVAREIHRRSSRSDDVFISADMGAIPESLFESELFGNVKGAFTDAREDRAGRFETASGGTLFLDEIGNLPLSLQPKLLTVLNNRTIYRVGSNKPVKVDIRLICATNLPVYEMVAENRFRQDLLYRINTVEIKLPLLRERTGDLPILADHFRKIYSRKYMKDISQISPTALKKLEHHNWPGNIRELDHVIERAIIMSDSNSLKPGDFMIAGPKAKRNGLSLESYKLDDVEQKVIRKALSKHGGNVSKAAEELGLTRASLYRRIQKYDI